MKNLTPEIIEKAKAAASAEELLAIAKENNVEMTADEADKYYDQIASNELDDDLLDGVAGGYAQEEEPVDEDDQIEGVFESPFTSVSTARPAKTGCK